MTATTASAPFRIVHTVCSHDCPDSCAVLVTVDGNGRAVKVEGDPSHPVTRGFLCGKVAKYLDRAYAPDRILYPMRRKAGAMKGALERGREHEAFERVSWDEALDAIAARLKETADRHGPESILPYSYAGTIGVLGYGSMDRRFFHRLGASQLDRTICSEAGGQAWNLVYGKKIGLATEDFRLAKLIVAWGANIHGNNAADRDRSLSHAHGGACRLAHCDPPGHRRSAGAGHDACDSRRGPGRPRLHCEDDARI
jgi:anaerobic selenocysteine-containing dehydrogenase